MIGYFDGFGLFGLVGERAAISISPACSTFATRRSRNFLVAWIFASAMLFAWIASTDPSTKITLKSMSRFPLKRFLVPKSWPPFTRIIANRICALEEDALKLADAAAFGRQLRSHPCPEPVASPD